jgi:hypothetical protein
MWIASILYLTVGHCWASILFTDNGQLPNVRRLGQLSQQIFSVSGGIYSFKGLGDQYMLRNERMSCCIFCFADFAENGVWDFLAFKAVVVMKWLTYLIYAGLDYHKRAIFAENGHFRQSSPKCFGLLFFFCHPSSRRRREYSTKKES